MTLGDQRAYQAAQHVAQTSYSKLVAYIAKQTRDVALAEDALSEAFAAALKDWPKQGIPDKPEAWLLAVAKRKFIDAQRRRKGFEAGVSHLQMLADELDQMIAQEKVIPDERLALMFACAHPALDQSVRAPMILQTILGLNAEQIASAFLVAPATMGQRLARAKAKIKLAGVPFRVPEAEDLAERLDDVLDAVYAAFSTAWIDPASSTGALAEEAVWLGRLICQLMPDAAEVLGLTALMLFLHARRDARQSGTGEFVPLSDQETSRWDVQMIDEAETLLRRAQTQGTLGRYQLEAAIQSAHAARRLTFVTDWPAIALLYDALYESFGSSVIAINRAVARGEVDGAARGLELLPAPEDYAELNQFQPYWAARAHLLSGVGRLSEAADAYELAIGLSSDQGQREFLMKRRSAVNADVYYLPPFPQSKAQT